MEVDDEEELEFQRELELLGSDPGGDLTPVVEGTFVTGSGSNESTTGL